MKNLASLLFLTAMMTTAMSSSPTKTTTTTVPIPLPSGCAMDLVTLSPCLSFISEPPNDVASNPTTSCCDAFTGGGGKVASEADSGCLCHLVVDSKILGFPINSTRIFQLFNLCNSKTGDGGSDTEIDGVSFAFQGFCDVPGAIPPLRVRGEPENDDSAPATATAVTVPSGTNSGGGEALSPYTNSSVIVVGRSPEVLQRSTEVVVGFTLLLLLSMLIRQ